MCNYSNIFDEVISTSVTKEKVKQIIPILVGWAKAGVTDKTYGRASSPSSASTSASVTEPPFDAPPSQGSVYSM